MICQNCNAKVDASVNKCPYCGSEITLKGHTTIGNASLILGILAIVCIVGVLALVFSGFGDPAIMIIVSIFSILCFILPIIAIALGAIAYFGKSKDTYGLIGFILGICLIIAAPIGIAATTYVYVSGMMGPGPELHPIITFTKTDFGDENSLTVIVADPDTLLWQDIELQINGVKHYHGKTGIIIEGEWIDITSIAGTGEYTVQFIYMPSDLLIAQFEFYP